MLFALQSSNGLDELASTAGSVTAAQPAGPMNHTPQPPLSPSIGGASEAGVGVVYTLDLNANGVTEIKDWSISWGDGTTGSIDNLPICNHIFGSNSIGSDIITATIQTYTGTSYAASTQITVAAAPSVESFAVNGGSVSRSSVTSLGISFSEPVQINPTAGAFTITQTATSGSLLPATFAYQLTSSNAGQDYTLTFPQSAFPGDIGFSLPSGTYSISVNPSEVTDLQGVQMENGQTFSFYCLGGDTTGSGTVGGISYHPAVSINPIKSAVLGTPLTLSVQNSPFGNNGDSTHYQWIIQDNGTTVMLPGSYGNGEPLPAGETQISPIGSVITAEPSLTFIPSGTAGSWTATVIATDINLNLSTITPSSSFTVSSNNTPDLLSTSISPATQGLGGLSYNGETLIAGPIAGGYAGVSAIASDGTTPGGTFYQFNPLTGAYGLNTTTFSGTVQYSRQPNELDYTFTLTNNASSGINFVGFDVTLAYDIQNISTPTSSTLSVDVSTASCSILRNGVAVGTITDGLQEQTPGQIGLFGNTQGIMTTASFDTQGNPNLGEAVDQLSPGQSVTFHAFLRFSPVAGANLGSDVDQALSTQAFQQSDGSTLVGNGSVVDWNDRRPITAMFPMTTNPVSPVDNPILPYELLSYASNEITSMLADGSQGGITWDFSDPFSGSAFDGAPELATTLIPQLGQSIAGLDLQAYPTIGKYYVASASDTLADEYFAMFRNAGLETGVTIRTTNPYPLVPQGVVWQTPASDEASLLIGRIQYALQNWGCTLFYIDSTTAGAELTTVLAAVHAAEPSVLLIPEHTSDADFSSAAGYYQEAPSTSVVRIPGVSDVTKPAVQIAYPQGFLITRADLSNPGFSSADIPTMAASLSEGDTFFIQSKGPAFAAQQRLEFNDSTGNVIHLKGSLSFTVVTAPDGLVMADFWLNGNVVYSQLTASDQWNGNTDAHSSVHKSKGPPLGSTSVARIEPAEPSVWPSSSDVYDDSISNDNQFLALL